MSSETTFFKQIDKFAKEADLSVSEAVKGIKISVFNGIIRDERVDTGRLRGNWQISNGAPILVETDRNDNTAHGVNGGKAQDDVIATVKGKTTDYLTNNLPYAEVWEEVDGKIPRNIERVVRNLNQVIKEK